MRSVDPREERVGDVLGAIASVWFAFTAWWGEFQLPAGGHIGAGAAATTMLAEASLKWHTIYPLFDWYAVKNPYPVSAYCHHPFGQYWLSALALTIFGHRSFVPDLPAAVMSTLTVPLLYATCKRAWGPLAAAAGALGFAFVPIAVGFSDFHNLEVMVMFGVVLFLYGQMRFLGRGRRRDLLISVVGALFACSGDWVGYLVMAPLLAFAFARAWVLPRWLTPKLDMGRYAKWWAWSVCVAVGTLVLWVALFKRADKLDDWMNSADSRSGAAGVPLSAVLEARRTWIDFSFTPFVIALGKLGAFVALARAAWRRVDEEVFSLAVLFGATVQYVAFKRGADVHIFWPHYFALFYGFALAQIVATLIAFAKWLGARVSPTRARELAFSAAVLFAIVPAALVAPDAVRALKIWRETGGKYNDNGTLLRSHADMLVVVDALLRPKLRHGESVGYHSGANWGWEHAWALDGPSAPAEAPSNAHPFWVARASGLGADHLRDVAKKFHLRIYGDTVLVVRGEPNAPLDAYSLDEHEPNLFQWMFVNNVEPVRRVSDVPDPFATWEWRYHLGEEPAAMPQREPSTLEEIRIAHNMALARGDAAAAERWLEKIRSEIVRDPETSYDGGSELMGVRVTHGVKPTLEIWFQAGGPTTADTTFVVRSSIVKKNPLSWMPVDPVQRDMAWPPPLSTKLWKKGFVYKFEAVLNHRIGLERYFGHWRGGPARRRGIGDVDLVYVP